MPRSAFSRLIPPPQAGRISCAEPIGHDRQSNRCRRQNLESNRAQHPMIFLSSAAAFGFFGFIAILRDRHTTALFNFIWCLVLLFAYCFFPGFPQ